MGLDRKLRGLCDDIAFVVVSILLPVLGLVILLAVPVLGIIFCITVGYFFSMLTGYEVWLVYLIAFLVALPGGALIMPKVMESIRRVCDAISDEVERVGHERWLRKHGLRGDLTDHSGLTEDRAT